MVDKKFHTLPVVDQDKLVGVVGKEDVLPCPVNRVNLTTNALMTL
jgi:predicted transcriptional regulator